MKIPIKKQTKFVSERCILKELQIEVFLSLIMNIFRNGIIIQLLTKNDLTILFQKEKNLIFINNSEINLCSSNKKEKKK
jgi:hypothetical protein